MRLSLEASGLRPVDVGYVNAHGSGTLAGDFAEASALRRVFGDGSGPRVSSIKGATGHTLGASGALEAAATVRALDMGKLPANVFCRDPLSSLAPWLVLEQETLSVGAALSLSMGFGGHNVALLFTRV